MTDIRPMQDSDAEGMHRVHTRAVSQLCAPFVSEETVNAWLFGRTPEGYLKAAEDHGETFWIASDAKQQVVGFASWREDELVSLFVDPRVCGQGVGRRLFAACEADAKKNGFEISRLKSTRNAETFYALLGFQKIETGYDLKQGQQIPYIVMTR